MYSAYNFFTVTDKNEEVFCFERKDMFPTIFDYSHFKKTIKLTDGVYSISDKVNKVTVTTISELRKLAEEYVNIVFNMDSARAEYTGYDYLTPFRNQIETELLVNQLIFDVLYDKFKIDSSQMTLYHYCENYIDVCDELYDAIYDEIYNDSEVDDCDAYNVTFKLFLECYKRVRLTTESPDKAKDTIFRDIENKAKNEPDLAKDFDKARETLREYIHILFDDVTKEKRRNAIKNAHELMREEIKREIGIMNNPAIREQGTQLGVDPDLFFEYFSTLNEPLQDNIKKPQYVWDYIYYNATPHLVTSKQYRRTLKRDSNTSYVRFAQELDYYDKFIQRTFEVVDGDSKCYYTQSMNYYHLEKYKKLDFMYKLAMRMRANKSLCRELSEFGSKHFFVKRYTPEVCCPFDVDGKVHYKMEQRYYPPLVFVDELFQEQGRFQNQKYFDIWHKHHLIRAKVYELFRYHNTFALEDYDDITHFIRKDYNILSYHDTNKVWGDVGEKVTKEQKELIKNVVAINDTLFWKSNDRDPVVWENLRKTECE